MLNDSAVVVSIQCFLSVLLENAPTEKSVYTHVMACLYICLTSCVCRLWSSCP